MNSFAEDKENYGEPKKEVRDFKRGLTYAWWGGHQVTIYDSFGREINIFNVGDFSKDNASREEISKSIEKEIKSPMFSVVYDEYGNKITDKGVGSEEGRCSEGYHWVKTHYTKNGTEVSGHCARNPYGSTQHHRSYGRRR